MSNWRNTYKVHPAADVFPMMSDEELDALGKDIQDNLGLREPITFGPYGLLLDGRNRLEAAERVGYKIKAREKRTTSLHCVAYIISANIHRRHLTKQQQADLIVAVHKATQKPRQVGEVSGGRGKVDKVKAAAIATAKEHGISKRTVERSFAKARGSKPKPQPVVVETSLPKFLDENGDEFEPLTDKKPLKEYRRLVTAWDSAGPEARRLFLAKCGLKQRRAER